MAWALHLEPPQPSTAREPEDGTHPRDRPPPTAHHPGAWRVNATGPARRSQHWGGEPAGASDPSAGNSKLPSPIHHSQLPRKRSQLWAGTQPALPMTPVSMCTSCEWGRGLAEPAKPTPGGSARGKTVVPSLWLRAVAASRVLPRDESRKAGHPNPWRIGSLTTGGPPPEQRLEPGLLWTLGAAPLPPGRPASRRPPAPKTATPSPGRKEPGCSQKGKGGPAGVADPLMKASCHHNEDLMYLQ